jgi:hypothetical protein
MKVGEVTMCNIKYSLEKYEGSLVNRSQVDIKLKIYDIQTWKKITFLDISSTNNYTLVPSLY